MRDLPVEIQTYLAQVSGVVIRQLLWIAARNRETGDPESIGLWSGDDHINFVIDGETRLYYGCGDFVSYGDLMLESALNIRKLVAKVTPISPEVEQVVRGYDAKMAPVETHLAFYWPETNNLVAPPVRMFKGWIDTFPIRTPSVGGSGEGTINMVGNTRHLTKRLALKRSDETQRKRSASDSFYNDVGMSGQVQTPWGSKL